MCVGSLPQHTVGPGNKEYGSTVYSIRNMEYEWRAGANMKLICYAKNFTPGGLEPKSAKAFASSTTLSLSFCHSLSIYIVVSLSLQTVNILMEFLVDPLTAFQGLQLSKE